MSKDPPVVPRCLFMAKLVSHVKKRPAELNLEVTLEGSQPQVINFSVDVDSQGECAVNAEILLGTNFHGQATPTKTCTHEELVTTKIYPLKI